MKVIIAGSRSFEDYELLKEKMDHLLSNRIRAGEEIEVVSGGAHGADTLGARYATARRFQLHLFPAEWKKYGRSAGFRRNDQMAERADALVAFWDGKSAGTAHMISSAKKKGIPVRIIRF